MVGERPVDAPVTGAQPSGRPTSIRVVEAVADANSVDPMTLDPLYRTIDPDSLDALFPAGTQRSTADGPSITFAFAGQRVDIESDGSIDVAETGDRAMDPSDGAAGADDEPRSE